MKIVLVEEGKGQPGPERAFEQPTIKIGRDPADCLVVFDQAEWPMVSRKHAEIRFKDGRYLLVDTNSSFGTFLNGNRVTEPAEISAGFALQFGAGGPILRVARIEQVAPSAGINSSFAEQETHRDLPTPPRPPVASKPTPAAPPPPAAKPAPPAKPSPAAVQPTVELMRTATGKMERVTVSDKEVVMLGRDPSSDVVIDADAAVVSRRHAEIRRRDGQCVLFDLGSFNGTLINDQRITAPTPLYDGDRVQLGMGGPILRFNDPAHPAKSAAAMPAGQRVVSGAVPVAGAPAGFPAQGENVGMHTMVIKSGSGSLNQQMPRPMEGGQQPQLLMQLAFDGRPQLSIGRAPDNDIRLDGLQISNHHARVKKDGNTVFIEDAGSTKWRVHQRNTH